MARLKKGDLVEVIAGRSKGEKGRILKCIGTDYVIVEGVNIQKRHIKPGARQSMPQGGILDRPGKIHMSNVRFWSDALGRGVRVGFKVREDGTKVRVARGQGVSDKELD